MKQSGRTHVLNGRTGQQMPLDAVIIEDLERQAGRYNLLERMKTAAFPVVLIQGTQDSERLRRGSEQLVNLRPDIERVQIPEGNHTFGSVHPFAGTTPQLEQAIGATREFIRSVLAG